MSVSVGEIVEGTVSDIMNYGAFVKLNDGKTGLVHISEVSKDFVKDIHSVLNEGDLVKAKVLSIDEKGKIALSIKKALPTVQKIVKEQTEEGPTTLDDMLIKFLRDSDERQLELKRSIESKRGASRRRE